MFGKLMNNFYYGKSGKGDYRKEDLPKNRWELFWEMLRVRFAALFRLNLMYMVVWLPTMIVLLMGGMSIVTGLTDETMQSAEALAEWRTSVQGIISSTLVLLIPCIAITGPCTAGVCYVTRNWARDEHAFIWSDFKDAVKDNWKQALVISIITGFMPIIVYVCWNFYGEQAAQMGFMVVPQILTAMLGMIWVLALSFFYPLRVSYKLKMKELFRNGFLLAVGRFPQTIGLRMLHMVPAIIALVCAFFFNVMWAMLGLFVYYLLLGFALSRFITASYTNAVFDKYINSHIEGAVVNRGLSQETDDDGEDEEDQEQEQQHPEA